MSLFSENRFKSLSAEYVEESYRNAPDVSEESDVALDESYLDLLLESLNDEE